MTVRKVSEVFHSFIILALTRTLSLSPGLIWSICRHKIPPQTKLQRHLISFYCLGNWNKKMTRCAESPHPSRSWKSWSWMALERYIVLLPSLGKLVISEVLFEKKKKQHPERFPHFSHQMIWHCWDMLTGCLAMPETKAIAGLTPGLLGSLKGANAIGRKHTPCKIT